MDSDEFYGKGPQGKEGGTKDGGVVILGSAVTVGLTVKVTFGKRR